MRQRALILGLYAGWGLLLTPGVLQVCQAQESSSKPEAPTPKTVQSPVPLSKYSPPGSVSKTPDGEPETLADLSALAISFATDIAATNCQPKSCTFLVTDFTLPDGKTSAYGQQIADTLSRQLSNNEYKLRMIDRKLLQDFVSKERVPAQSDHRAIVHWFSDELDARFIVFGTTEKMDNGLVRLLSQLIDANSKGWPVYKAIVYLDPPKVVERPRPRRSTPAIAVNSNKF
jgi:hypothetical protein